METVNGPTTGRPERSWVGRVYSRKVTTEIGRPKTEFHIRNLSFISETSICLDRGRNNG